MTKIKEEGTVTLRDGTVVARTDFTKIFKKVYNNDACQTLEDSHAVLLGLLTEAAEENK